MHKQTLKIICIGLYCVEAPGFIFLFYFLLTKKRRKPKSKSESGTARTDNPEILFFISAKALNQAKAASILQYRIHFVTNLAITSYNPLFKVVLFQVFEKSSKAQKLTFLIK